MTDMPKIPSPARRDFLMKKFLTPIHLHAKLLIVTAPDAVTKRKKAIRHKKFLQNEIKRAKIKSVADNFKIFLSSSMAEQPAVNR
jgi:hypothetical protein